VKVKVIASTVCCHCVIQVVRWFSALCRALFWCSSSYVRDLTFIMSALWNRAGHYMFALWFLSFLLSSFFFIPRLISAAADWMSTILPHMVWKYCRQMCKFRMQVWNVLHVARLKCWTQKIAKNSPSGHHRTSLSAYIFATKARIDNRKKNLLSSNISSTCLRNMVNFSLLAAEIVSLVWGTPANINGFRVLAAFCTAL